MLESGKELRDEVDVCLVLGAPDGLESGKELKALFTDKLYGLMLELAGIRKGIERLYFVRRLGRLLYLESGKELKVVKEAWYPEKQVEMPTGIRKGIESL